MIVTHKIKMDLSEGGETPRINIVQNDKYTRNIEISLFSNGTKWPVPEGITGVVHYLKPDGTGGSYDALPDGTTACIATDNILSIALAPQVCTSEGIVRLAVSMILGQAELHTFSILIYVRSNPEINLEKDTYVSLAGVLPYGGWKPNIYLGTDTEGNIVEKPALKTPESSSEVGVPENVALLEDVTADEASGDFFPMLSPNGTEYRLSVGNDGIPVIKNASRATVWSGTSGGSSGGDTGGGEDTGGDNTGGDNTGGGGTDVGWTSGVPYTLTIIADEYIDKSNGKIVPYTSWSRTDYTPCAGVARLTVTGVTYSGDYNAFYDVNKVFISAFSLASSGTAEITVPDNAAFFIISASSASVANTVVTPYET